MNDPRVGMEDELRAHRRDLCEWLADIGRRLCEEASRPDAVPEDMAFRYAEKLEAVQAMVGPEMCWHPRGPQRVADAAQAWMAELSRRRRKADESR
jgi:hypothetical protein